MTLSNPAQYISGRTVQEQMNSLIDYVDQRAADVALDAIASDVAQVHQDMLDADADATAAAASAAAAAGTLANAVKKTGEASQSIAGDISIAGSLTAGSISSPGNVNGATIGGSTSDMVARDIIVSGTAYIDDTEINGDLEVTESTAVIDMSGAANVLAPDSAVGSYSTKNVINAPRLKDELDNYAPMVRVTDNQTIGGNKTFTGIMINATDAPMFSKLPENTGGKYLALFEYQGQAVITMRIVAGVSNTVAIFDLRGSSATCAVETHSIAGERYVAPSDILICTNDASNKKWTVYMKYPQNRRVMIYVDTFNAMFANTTLNPGQITSLYSGTLIDNPSGDYSEVVAGVASELKTS